MTHSFNPADHDAGIALSNSNLTATATTASWKSARTAPAFTTGKWYFEFKANVIVGNSWTLIIGFMNASASLSNYVGSDANSFGLQSGGVGYLGSGGAGTPPSYAQGDVVGVAFDADAKLCWFNKNGGTWSGNPVAGTTGCNLAGLDTGGSLYPSCSIFDATAQGTIDFLNSTQNYTPPTGFSAPDIHPVVRPPRVFSMPVAQEEGPRWRTVAFAGPLAWFYRTWPPTVTIPADIEQFGFPAEPEQFSVA